MASRTTTYLEIESTYAADASLVVPGLDDLGGVAEVQTASHELVAQYLDTDDLRLARAGVTLRRRTGGDDEGWHLKLPSGHLERLEVHRPLGRSARPPRLLTDLVLAHVRGARLAPVATITTRREVVRLLDGSGVLLAELADDHVRGEVPGRPLQEWRELEVERGAADDDLLAQVSRRLQDAGAGPAGSTTKLLRLLEVTRTTDGPHKPLDKDAKASKVVRRHLAEQVEALVAADPRARIDAPDAVHKMRVATRRLRSALATYRPLLEPDAAEQLRVELQWLGQVLGGPRDAEVMHARLVAALDELPPELVVGPVRRRVDRTLRDRHRETHAELVRELRGERYLALLAELDELVGSPPFLDVAGKRAGKALPPLVAKAARRVNRLAHRAAEAESDARDLLLHDVRKAAKRARYAGESVTLALGTRASDHAARMERVQEVLGDHQDSIVTRDLLRELGVQAHLAGENGFTYGLLHGLEQAHGALSETELDDALGDVERLPGWLR